MGPPGPQVTANCSFTITVCVVKALSQCLHHLTTVFLIPEGTSGLTWTTGEIFLSLL